MALAFLDRLIGASEIAAPALTAAWLLFGLWSGRLRLRPPPPLSPRRSAAFLALGFLCALAYAAGAGGCMAGGFLKGAPVCPPLASSGDFVALQVVYGAVFAASAALAALLALLAFRRGRSRLARALASERLPDSASRDRLAAAMQELEALGRRGRALRAERDEIAAERTAMLRFVRALLWLALVAAGYATYHAIRFLT